MSNVVVHADFQPTPSQMPASMKTAELRAATSVLLERMQFLRAAGMSFNGLRDLYNILGYPRVISPAQYRDRYARGGIAGRVVDAMPKATWRGGVEIIEDEDPEVSTTFEETCAALMTRLKLTQVFQRLDILAQQCRYGVLLLGAPGDFNQELPKGKPEQLVYVTPFAEEDARVMEWELDEHNPRFGQPTHYQLSRLTANSLANIGSWGVPAFSPAALQQPVHWSRVIHVPAEGILDNEVFGPPALERVWNLLDDLDKVIGGGAEAFWLRANQGLHLNIDKDTANVKPEDLKDLKDQADEYQHQIRRILRTRGVDVNELGSDVANFSNPADAVVTQIAGSKAIPKRILTGSEMGELASSQDRENFRDQVNGRQLSYAEPTILRQFFDRLITYKYIVAPKKGAEAYQIKWAHVQVLTEQEKAEGASKWASVNNTQGAPVFLNREIRDKWYAMPPLTPEEIQKEKELAKPLEPPAPPPGAPGTVDENGNPVEPGKTLPGKNPQSQGPRAKAEDDTADTPAKARAAADAAQLEPIITLLERALREGNTALLDQVLGIRHETQQTIVLPDVTIQPPPATTTTVRKVIEYGDVHGTVRPIAITETTDSGGDAD